MIDEASVIKVRKLRDFMKDASKKAEDKKIFWHHLKTGWRKSEKYYGPKLSEALNHVKWNDTIAKLASPPGVSSFLKQYTKDFNDFAKRGARSTTRHVDVHKNLLQARSGFTNNKPNSKSMDLGALKHYTGWGASEINAELHENHRGFEKRKIQPYFDSENLGRVSALDRAFSHKEYHVGRDHTVFTGLPESPETIIALEKKRIGSNPTHVHAHLPAFTSTSTDPFTARDFGAAVHERSGSPGIHMLRIHVPAGHPSIPVSSVSHHGHEKEVLLHRGTRLKISTTPITHERPPLEGSIFGKVVTHIWDAEVVGHHLDPIITKDNYKPKEEKAKLNVGKLYKDVKKHVATKTKHEADHAGPHVPWTKGKY
jgi:hypothetical protein